MCSFQHFNFPASIAKAWTPSGIQAHTCPLIEQGLDIVAVAPHGSGKTVAYLLPCLADIVAQDTAASRLSLDPAPSVLCVVPTREACARVAEEARRLWAGAGQLRTAGFFGGASLASQMANLRRGCHAVIGTPDRLAEALKEYHLGLEGV